MTIYVVIDDAGVHKAFTKYEDAEKYVDFQKKYMLKKHEVELELYIDRVELLTKWTGH